MDIIFFLNKIFILPCSMSRDVNVFIFLKNFFFVFLSFLFRFPIVLKTIFLE